MRLSVLRASGLLGGCPADLGTSPASSTALRSLSSVALSSGYRPRSYAPNTSLAPNAPNSLLTEKLLNAYQPWNQIGNQIGINQIGVKSNWNQIGVRESNWNQIGESNWGQPLN